MLEFLLSFLVGLGLSAATGFRVFVPLLVMSVASRSGHLSLSPDFAWIGSWPALVTFAAATLFEVGGYYIPWLDNLLDTIATPAAVVAGTVVMASMVTDMSPFLRWGLAAIAGGGAAGVVQVSTGLVRLTSTATTGGLGNPVVSTAEAGGSFVLSIASILIPLAAGLALIAVFYLSFRSLAGKRRARLARKSSNAA